MLLHAHPADELSCFEVSSNAGRAWVREDDVMKHMRKYAHRGIFFFFGGGGCTQTKHKAYFIGLVHKARNFHISCNTGFLALLDYVSRTHEIEICPSSVRPSVCGIDYLWRYCMHFLQIVAVTSPGSYAQIFFFHFWFFFMNIFRFC